MRGFKAHILAQAIKQSGFEQRLGNKTADAGLTRLFLKFGPIVGGDQQNRDFAPKAAPYLPGDLEAVHIRKLPVQKNDLIVIVLPVALNDPFHRAFSAQR